MALFVRRDTPAARVQQGGFMSATVDFDVGVIGGGPAGSAMAAYLAKAGVSVVLLERELFPRPHVGESLVPSSTRAFKELGFLEEMERSGFPRKFGAVWTATGTSQIYEHDWEGLEADSVADIRFAERDQPGVDQTYTWHVDRGRRARCRSGRRRADPAPRSGCRPRCRPPAPPSRARRSATCPWPSTPRRTCGGSQTSPSPPGSPAP